MSVLKLDLHNIFNKGSEIDIALNNIFCEARNKHIEQIVIIPGKGTGQLKKRVLRFLNDKSIKKLYGRYKIDNKNFGKIDIYFNYNKHGDKK